MEFGNWGPFLGKLNDFLFTFLSHVSIHIPDLDKMPFIFLLSHVLLKSFPSLCKRFIAEYLGCGQGHKKHR